VTNTRRWDIRSSESQCHLWLYSDMLEVYHLRKSFCWVSIKSIKCLEEVVVCRPRRFCSQHCLLCCLWFAWD